MVTDELQSDEWDSEGTAEEGGDVMFEITYVYQSYYPTIHTPLVSLSY